MMKVKLITVCMMSVMSFGAMSQWIATTGLVGYSGAIHFEDGTSQTTTQATLDNCKAVLQAFKDEYYSPNSLQENGPIVWTTPCRNLAYNLIFPTIYAGSAWPDLFPVPTPGPRDPIFCPACTALGEDTFKAFYGDKDEYIREVFNNYRKKEYQLKLKDLQNEYNIEGFEKAVFELNSSLRTGR